MTSKKQPAASEPDAAPSFEQALGRLEKIVEDLEGGQLPLEESLARFEEGVKLSGQLNRTLEEAEKRIERLVEGPNGPSTVPDGSDPDSSLPPGEGELPF